MAGVDPALRDSVAQFLYREARLLDTHAYAEWEALWTDDGVYWVPARHDGDPAQDVALVHADRAGIARRIGRMKSSAMYAADPRPQLARVVANVEVEAHDGGVRVHSTFNLAEHRTRGPETWLRTWAGRCEHTLRRVDADWRIAFKKVYLLGSDTEVPALGFVL
jgi:benzoate/toluate 1,2-dioxygenase subunit beta